MNIPIVMVCLLYNVHIDVEHFTDFIQSNENTEGVSIFSQQNNIPKWPRKTNKSPISLYLKFHQNEWN